MRFRPSIVALLSVCFGLLTFLYSGSAFAVDKSQLTYDDILNTGLANVCPEISSFTRGTIEVEPNSKYFVSDFCMEPQEYFVKEEPINKRQKPEYVKGKVLTRQTTSLEQIRGTIAVAADGTLTFKEKDGIDFQPITVLLPGGEEVPFFFTVKSFTGTTEPGFTSINSSTDFVGDFNVPSYRGAGFLDPKARGLYTGYDNAVALPSAADNFSTNKKETPLGKGTLSLQVTQVDGSTGEIAGIFESEQPSDTDLGAKEPLDVKVRGIFYGRVDTDT
ncbi:photosystem II manganese-stabilizing polypeptide [Synechocystis sp. PCC 7339]|uniref:photosystem II manganese-stabilizing polypeptide n=1 Tax=Synechocystis TaxID=1142 RepID=UPI001882BA7E|nr:MULTISPECIES: photosystem II manganese-stabilizing polypeptide [Synechocystis]MBE9203090.1 photosystem II manganese-stabilizing polypeptide [Synechocystis salina LEGE 06099]QUS60780.1 photosystem II manganese-stabilizing polypeptide [Synechocystis sp. PCC 7338]UAJ72969.1 photosystem II manganese-stabilizing polypeptide [Synechocystis sp. PCC 7339]